MALLAEQKRKAKFGLDPRNTSWSNDSSKFGQRLLEKMGWEKGKGLGAHENGITEHIKASYKSDSRGLGCMPQDADAWIAHQDDFNDLLKALNSQGGAGSQEEQAEQKTTHVDGRKRYYGRFSRGQVQTLRSTDDLDCIFGKRKRKSKKAVSDEPPVAHPDGGDGADKKRHGLTTVTSTSSVQEYFAKKMAEMKARKESKGKGSVEADPSESSQGRRHGVDREKTPSAYSTVGFSYNVNEMKENSSPAGVGGVSGQQTCRGWYQDFLKDNSSDIQNIDIKEKSSKKKKRKKMKSDNEVSDRDVETKMSDGKKRKTKKECKDKMENGSVPILESNFLKDTSSSIQNIDVKKKSSKKKKRKKMKSDKDNDWDVETKMSDDKKRKTKKECKDKMVNGSVPILESSELPSTHKVEKNKPSKEKKNKKNETVAVAASAFDSTANINDENQDQKKHKKKKRKTCHKDKIVDDNSNRCALDANGVNDANNLKHSSKLSIIDSNEINVDRTQGEKMENSACDGYKKKNKKRKHSEINIDEESKPAESKSDNNDDVEVKSKKKKRKKDGCTGEPDEREAGGNDVQNIDNATAAEPKRKTYSAENKDVGDVTQPSGQREDERKKKKKKKKAKRAKEKCTKSNAFFPGSNIADILGYGLKSSETEKSSKEKSKSSKKKRLVKRERILNK